MSANTALLRVYLIDDELLALKRLARLLRATRRVQIVGSTTDPDEALTFLRQQRIDALFLDIQMPGLSGFDLLARLPSHPPVVFTTAFDHYALKAFEVNSVDYLLKPIEARQLERALNKLERMRGAPAAEARRVIEKLASMIGDKPATYLDRIASRLSGRVQLIELGSVTHFFAKDKLTYAATEGKNYVVDFTITELEKRLDPWKWLRIHRSVLLNVDFADEITGWFGGGLRIRLKNSKRTELTIARDRVRIVKERLGF